MTTILIVEDHKVFNDGLKTTLSQHFDIVGQIYDGREVISAVRQFNPAILVLDINLPTKNGLDIGREVKANFPNTKIAYLSMYSESSFIKAAKEIGAHGYFLKDWASDDIISALKNIEKGEIVFDEKLDDKKINLHHDDHFVKQFSLSKREIEIIKLIKEGNSTEAIAKQLALSFETVKSHRKNIYFKMKFKKLADLIQFAAENNI